jgi:hypothetical protein
MPLKSTFGAGSASGFGAGQGGPKFEFIVATGGTITTSGDYKIQDQVLLMFVELRI